MSTEPQRDSSEFAHVCSPARIELTDAGRKRLDFVATEITALVLQYEESAWRMISTLLEGFRDEVIENAVRNSQIKIIEVNSSAPPVADGPAGLSDSERLQAMIKHELCVVGINGPTPEWAVRSSNGLMRTAFFPSPTAAIDEAIRAARKTKSE